ncbi:MAG: radical SAM protein [Thermoleophilaceae bacterium]
MDELPHQTLRRLMLTIDSQPCPFGCRYCFARFSQYEGGVTLSTVEASPDLLTDIDVIYPACDVDLFVRKDAVGVLTRVARLGASISVSTKARLRPDVLGDLACLSKELASRGQVLKVGVSLTTKHRVREIEPRTPTYETRIAGLTALSSAGIPSALVLRPLLADIPDAEYEEIVSEASGATSSVLVGEEYLDSDKSQRRHLIAEPASGSRTKAREVRWLRERPVWPVRETAERVDRLRRFALRAGMRVFESDIDLMTDLIEGSAKGDTRPVVREFQPAAS